MPGLVGVDAGGRVRSPTPERHQTAGTLLLLTVIAAWLTTARLSDLYHPLAGAPLSVVLEREGELVVGLAAVSPVG